jgi:hypothetical protein
MKKNALILLMLMVSGLSCLAADTVLTWPPEGQASLKFTIGKLRQVNSYSGQADYVADVNVTNLGTKPVSFASFYVYLLDKSQKRIGEGYIELSNVGPGQQVKVPLTAHAMGNIASMQLHPQHLPSDEPRKVTVNVASVPAGASFKIDGQDAGLTPKAVQLVPGKHTLDFSKEDSIPDAVLNDILWHAVKGASVAEPPIRHGLRLAAAQPKKAGDGDDDDDD